MAAPRLSDQRRRDSLGILSAPGADAWVATASPEGEAYLVPLSIGWTGELIVLVTERRSPTARNLAASSRSRVALGGTRDVVMIDAEVVAVASLPDATAAVLETFATQSGWDPRHDSNAADYQVFSLRPARLQAWREANEIAGRTLMRDGAWVDPPGP